MDGGAPQRHEALLYNGAQQKSPEARSGLSLTPSYCNTITQQAIRSPTAELQ